ncbi:MAG: dihydropyrimidinase [Clostridia bacterium]|nr:dihydropyrimidinase [Clostridia bacterium]
MRKLIKGGTIVTAEKSYVSDILIENEKIIKIGENLSQDDCEVIDATGRLVFPGFIDAHTHFDLKTITTTADDFYTGTKAAIAGGTTSVVDFATADRGMTLMEALDVWHKKADGKSSCDYGFHMSFSEWNEELSKEVDLMTENGITSYKLYMAYDNLRVSDSDIFEILKRVDQVGGIVGTHCENGDMVTQLTNQLKKEGKLSPKYHPVSRPALVEAEAIFRYLTIAELAGVPVNIVHLSSKLGYDIAEQFRKKGNKVYIETCPQYLLMDDSVYEKGTLYGEKEDDEFASAKFVMSPPPRKEADKECLWDALRDDRIDCISTDHCSFNYKNDKELGREDFSKIPNGCPGVEHRPALIYNFGVLTKKITKEKMCAYLSTNPAKLYGMYPQKGVIAEGSDADIVIWNTDKEWTISATNQNQNCDYTPYEGASITGAPEKVLLRGNVISEYGKIIKENKGEYIFRGKSILYNKK